MLNSSNALSCLLLLGLASAGSIERRQNPGPPPLPADAQGLPKDCQLSLLSAGVTAGFKASKDNTDEYIVNFKLSANPPDVQSVLALPALGGAVKPIQQYTREYDIGFSAKLTYPQVCAIDKDPRVSGQQKYGQPFGIKSLTVLVRFPTSMYAWALHALPKRRAQMLLPLLEPPVLKVLQILQDSPRNVPV